LFDWNSKQRGDEEVRLRRYLLGELDDPIMDQVEIRLLRDKNYADLLVTTEDNLIDDYVFEGLSESELESFKSKFLVSDERRNKIMIARAMEVYVGERSGHQPEPEPATLSQVWHPSMRFLKDHKLAVAFSVLIVVLLAIFVPLLLRSLAPDGGMSPLQARRADIERRIAELNRQNSDAGQLVQVFLQPLVLREGSEIRKLLITSETRPVNINLQLPSGNRHEKYRAVVQTVEGTELFAIADLKAGQGVGSSIVAFKLTADVLPQGDYQIKLLADSSENVTSEVARYNLRVIH
jgi:hypothetical protein